MCQSLEYSSSLHNKPTRGVLLPTTYQIRNLWERITQSVMFSVSEKARIPTQFSLAVPTPLPLQSHAASHSECVRSTNFCTWKDHCDLLGWCCHFRDEFTEPQRPEWPAQLSPLLTAHECLWQHHSPCVGSGGGHWTGSQSTCASWWPWTAHSASEPRSWMIWKWKMRARVSQGC